MGLGSRLQCSPIFDNSYLLSFHWSCQYDAAYLQPCPIRLQELWPWLLGGYNAVLLLLGADSGTSSSCSVSYAAGGLGAEHVLAGLGNAAFSEGLQLGLSWQLVSSDAAHGTLHWKTQTAAEAAAKRQQARRPGTRLGREAAAQSSEASFQHHMVVHAATASELAQLLSAARQQEQQLTAMAGGGTAPALLLRLQLETPDGGPGAVLNVLQLGASRYEGCSGGSKDSPGAKQQAAAGSQEQALLRLLGEVADLHQRRREGEKRCCRSFAPLPACPMLACAPPHLRNVCCLNFQGSGGMARLYQA